MSQREVAAKDIARRIAALIAAFFSRPCPHCGHRAADEREPPAYNRRDDDHLAEGSERSREKKWQDIPRPPAPRERFF